MGAVATAIRDKLTDALAPTRLELEDDSARHAGHSGASAAGETHFNLTLESAAFRGLSRIARQRLVLKVLAAELAGPVHALSIKALSPGEA